MTPAPDASPAQVCVKSRKTERFKMSEPLDPKFQCDPRTSNPPYTSLTVKKPQRRNTPLTSWIVLPVRPVLSKNLHNFDGWSFQLITANSDTPMIIQGKSTSVPYVSITSPQLTKIHVHLPQETPGAIIRYKWGLQLG